MYLVGKRVESKRGSYKLGVLDQKLQNNLLQFCGTDDNKTNTSKESEKKKPAFPSKVQSHANSDNVDSLKQVFQILFITS